MKTGSRAGAGAVGEEDGLPAPARGRGGVRGPRRRGRGPEAAAEAAQPVRTGEGTVELTKKEGTVEGI